MILLAWSDAILTFCEILSQFAMFLPIRFPKYLTKCEVPHVLWGVRKGADQANSGFLSVRYL